MPALDGVRGVAVAAVVVFHLGVRWLPGGFLGVSTFFTLSGFLITSLLIEERTSSGAIDLASFWRRRVRRLLPASAVTLAAILALAPVAFSELQRVGLGGDVTAAAWYVANWRFMLAGSSYQDLFVAPSPVLHFWSLAIEEQFYLVFPLIAGVALGRGNHRRLRTFGVVLAVLAAASVLLAVVVDLGADHVYYSTATRAAELLVGALLAVGLAGGRRRLLMDGGRRWRISAGVAGLVGAVTSVVAFVLVSRTDTWLYRGGLAAFSLASACVLCGALADPGVSPVARVLRRAPIVALGRISYGVYVIHWPVFLALDQHLGGLDPVLLGACKVALTLLLAVASARFVERPIRAGVVPDKRVLVAVPLVAALLTGAAFATQHLGTAGSAEIAFGVDGASLPSPPLPGVPPVEPTSQGTEVPVAAGEVVIIGSPDQDALAQGAAEWLGINAPEVTVNTVLVPCGTTRAPIGVDFTTEQESCAGWVDGWTAALVEHDPDTVVMLLPLDHTTLPGWGNRIFREEAQAVVDLATSTGAELVTVATTGALETVDADVRLVAATQGSEAYIDLAPGEGGDAIGRQLSDLLLTRDVSVASGQRDEVPRVMIMGDSVASNLGLALEQWARRTGEATVWNAAALGCGLVGGGRTTARPPHDVDAEKCVAWRDAWAQSVDAFEPDIVVFMPSAWDLPDRTLPGWDAPRSIGDSDFDAWLRDGYQSAVDTWGSEGATVVMVTLPCTGAIWTGYAIAKAGAFDNARIDALNDLGAHDLDGAREVDLAAHVCPGGEYTQALGGLEEARPDGLHFSKEAALWVADWLGPEILAAAPG